MSADACRVWELFKEKILFTRRKHAVYNLHNYIWFFEEK